MNDERPDESPRTSECVPASIPERIPTRIPARIIDGALHDARTQARAIVERARIEAKEIRQRAYEQGVRNAARQATLRHPTGHEHQAIDSHDGQLERTTGEPVGSLSEIVGSTISAQLDDEAVRHGDIVHLEPAAAPQRAILAQVVGFRERRALLVPLGACRGLAPGDPIFRRASSLTVGCGDGLLGRVLDGLGRLLDPGPRFVPETLWPVHRAPVAALDQPAIERPLATGVRALDGLLTCGRGQRVALLAGPGLGKSSLLGRMARTADVDVCVVALIGERGRELRDLIDRRLDAESRRRTVVVCATSDAPGMVRVRAAEVATAIAEWFCEARGAHVLLLVDSLTRWARARREVGLAAGEWPVRRGYPASVFSELPRLIERAGPRPRGCISAIYAVLTEAEGTGDPLAAEVRALVDGHIRLSEERAARGQWPAIDVLGSLSRVMERVTTPEHRAAARRVRQLMAAYRESAELLAMGAYRPGSDTTTDRAIAARAAIDDFLCHEETIGYQASVTAVRALADRFR